MGSGAPEMLTKIPLRKEDGWGEKLSSEAWEVGASGGQISCVVFGGNSMDTNPDVVGETTTKYGLRCG